jgi:hypothetical protein
MLIKEFKMVSQCTLTNLNVGPIDGSTGKVNKNTFSAEKAKNNNHGLG